MVLVVADLPQRGREFKLDAFAWAKTAVSTGVGGEVKAFTGSLALTRHGEHVALRGELHAVAEVPCSRCGAPLPVSIGGDVACVYSPLSTLPVTKEDEDGLPRPPINLDFKVTDVGEYDGVKFDLAQALLEWATVEAPARLRCADLDSSEDAECSSRFRAAAQSSQAPTVDPRFAILQSLKADST